MILAVHHGTAKNGKIKFDRPEEVTRKIESLLDGKRVSVMICEEPRHPTWEQFKYYRDVVLGCYSEITGHDPERIHEFLLDEFYGIAPGDGTSQMSLQEMSAHIERSKRFFFEFFDCVIPDPEKVWSARHRDLI